MKYIETNMGQIPLEDYLDIRARQYGFEDYEELERAGYTLEIKQGPANLAYSDEE